MAQLNVKLESGYVTEVPSSNNIAALLMMLQETFNESKYDLAVHLLIKIMIKIEEDTYLTVS